MPAPSSGDDAVADGDEAGGEVTADDAERSGEATADGGTEQPVSDEELSYPSVETESRFVTGFALLRESAMATVGLLALFAGLSSVDDFLNAGVYYPAGQLFDDLLYVFVGVYLLFAAVGAAARRVRAAS